MVDRQELERVKSELVDIHSRLHALQQSIDQRWDDAVEDHVWNRVHEAKRHIEAAVFDEINPVLREQDSNTAN